MTTADANASHVEMPALGRIADLGRGYTIENVGSRYYGLYAIRYGAIYLGTARSRGDVMYKIEEFEAA